MAASSPDRTPVANALLALAVLLGFGAALEGTSRYLEARRPAALQRAAYIWDWETMWEGDFYTVGAGALGWPARQAFNVDGLRDRTHTPEKRPRTFRLVFLGDSVTLGAGLPPERAYPQALQRRLEASGRRVEVFNVALWGWSIRQERTAYERLVRRYRPDRVVLAICLNDIPELQNNLARPPAWLQKLHERLALVRLIVDAPGREIGRVEELFERPDAPSVRAGFERFEQELRALRSAVEGDGATFAVMVFPFRFQVEPGAPAPRAQERLAGICRRNSVPFVDLLPALAPLGARAFVDYDHLSQAGARRTAEVLAGSALVPTGFSYAEDLAPLAAGERASLEPLLEALADRDAARRAAAGWALRQHLEAPGVTAALVERLRRDPDAGVRATAVESLACSQAAATATSSGLFAALDDASQDARWAAARALAARGPRAAHEQGDLDRLIERLRHPDLYVRAWAAWTLGELGPRAARAAPALVEALQLEGRSAGVASRALAALGPAGEAQVPALIAVLAHPEPARRWNASLALGLLGPAARPAVPALVTLVDDGEPRVRASAALALGRIGLAAPEVLEVLRRALAKDPEGDVRTRAARALGWLGQPAAETLAALEAAGGDDVRRVRVEAGRALARLRGEAAPEEREVEP